GDDLGLITRDRVESLGHDVVGLPTAFVVALAILVLIAMPVRSVIVFTLFNWDFTVHQRDGSLLIDRGLVTRRSVSLERRRLRGVELADNPFERAAGAARLAALISALRERRRRRAVDLADSPFDRAAGVARLGGLITGLGDAAHRGRLLPAAPRAVSESLAGRVVGAVAGPLAAHPPAARSRRITRAV